MKIKEKKFKSVKDIAIDRVDSFRKQRAKALEEFYSKIHNNNQR